VQRRRRHSSPFLAFAGLGLAAVALVAPAVVLGHSTLETADPAANGTVPESPTLIVANFTERIDPARSSMELRGPDGSVLAKGGVAPGDPEAVQMTITPPTLGVGTYEIRWTTVTPDDNGIERGTYTITVAAASTSPATPATPSGSAEEGSEPPASFEAGEMPERSSPPSMSAEGSPAASGSGGGPIGGSGSSGPDLVVVAGFAVLAVIVVGAVVLVTRSRRA